MQNLGKEGEGGRGKQDALWEMCKWRIVKTDLRAAVRKYRLGVCKMKKSKIPKLCQNIGLGKLFLEK